MNALFAAAARASPSASPSAGCAARWSRAAAPSRWSGLRGATAVTFSPAALTQPRFEGLLSQAAYIADLGEATAQDYASYRDTLAEFVGQVSALYIAADSLPVGLDQENLVTVLHVSDIHDNPQAYDVIRSCTRSSRSTP